jgi:DNA-binding response OmpR family regulator
MNDVTKFLIIDDSDNVIEALTLLLMLSWPHAVIVSARRGEQGIMMAEKEMPDIIILDLGLPDISGYEVLSSIRLFSDVPIIILTVRSSEDDIFKGLGLGADDYLVKPFKRLEMLARLKALARRPRNIKQAKPLLRNGHFILNTEDRVIDDGQKQIKLSQTECKIIAHLIENSGRAVSHASIAIAIWGADYPDSSKALKVHIRRIRQKIEKDPSNPEIIITKPGLGYLFSS